MAGQVALSRTLEESLAARPFQTRLAPAHEPSARENKALQRAIEVYARRKSRDDTSAWATFLTQFPNGAWAPSVHIGLGGEYLTFGRYTRAIDHWTRGFKLASASDQRELEELGGHALAELALMYARLGRREDLRELLQNVERPVGGGSGVRLKHAIEGLAKMDRNPGVAYRCGTVALSRLLAHTAPGRESDERLRASNSPEYGFSLLDVARFSADLGLKYQPAFRERGAPIIVPAVVHWSVGHYAALIKERKGLHLIDDPTFRTEAWLSSDALDLESSGYFLVPAGPLPAGWRSVSPSEADRVLGKGTTSDSDPDATNPYDQTAYPRDRSCGLATWNVGLLLINQIITDTPVGYTPPVGDAVYFTATFNSLDQGIGSGSHFVPSLGYLCSHNWLSFITVETMNEFAMVQLYAPGGGTLRFYTLNEAEGSFYNQFYGRGTLWRVSTNRFEYRHSDGSKWVYAQPDGSVGATRRVFLTEIRDRTGNATRLEYDSSLRVTRVVDAIDQATIFTYVASTNMSEKYRIAGVTDPFGRTARFSYDWIGFLTNITDVAGLNSALYYDGPYFEALRRIFEPPTYLNRVFVGRGRPGSGGGGGEVAVYNPFLDGVAELQTPYGITRFRRGYGGTSQVWMEVTSPDGLTERFEYSENSAVGIASSDPLRTVPQGMGTQNDWLYARNSYHWDKRAFAESYRPNDYRGARIYHFTHGLNLSSASPILESVKLPLENRVWFAYPGQSSSYGDVVSWFAGKSDRPTRIGRVLDDGTTQLYQFEYNDQQNVTKSVDPAGRQFSYTYASNGLDLLEVRQTRAGRNELLGRITYNNQHLPVVFVNAAGQTNRFGYNARGQLTAVTNGLGEVTLYEYDSAGYLSAVDGPAADASDRRRLTYDGFGRLNSAADADGYSWSFEYDVLDRLTKIIYPDGTFESIQYRNLDAMSVRDRSGRENRFEVNAVRQLTSFTDALGRVTRFEWCTCGDLEAVIDPLGRTTRWLRDVQGRVTAKIHPDGSAIRYAYEPESGRLSRVADEQGRTRLLRYNVDGTMREKTYQSSVPTPALKFFYDPDYLRLTMYEDGQGRTTLNYNPISNPPVPGAGMLESIDGPLAADVIRYKYDALGRIIERSINGVASKLTLDVLGRQVALANPLGNFQYEWVATSSRLAKMIFPNGQQVELRYYDALKDRLLQQIIHTGPGGTPLSKYEYDYDSSRRIVSWVKDFGTLGRFAWSLGYDAGDRLTNITSGATTVAEYTYDAASNLAQVRDEAGLRETAYNELDQPLTRDPGSSAGSDYEWDAENRLVAIVRGALRSEFQYDALDRRVRVIEKNEGNVVSDRRYLWCGPDVAEERDTSGTNVLKRFFTHGEQWLQAGGVLPAGSYFYTIDHLGSVRQLVSGAGQAVAAFEYGPYGKQTVLTGGARPSFGFAGYYQHQPSGTMLSWYRAYDPDMQRWLSRDLAGGGLGENLYTYAAANPVNRIDPFGLSDSALSRLPATKSSQQLQQGVDALENAKKVGKAVESVVEKGIKEAAKDKIEEYKNDKLDEVQKSMSATEEYKRIAEENAKTAASVDPFGKLVGKHVNTASDALAGCQQKPAPKVPPAPKPKEQDSPSVLDKILEFLGFDRSPPSPQKTIQESISSQHQQNVGFEAKAANAY